LRDEIAKMGDMPNGTDFHISAEACGVAIFDLERFRKRGFQAPKLLPEGEVGISFVWRTSNFNIHYVINGDDAPYFDVLPAIDVQPDPRDAQIAALGPIADILPDAVAAAEKAMRKYPQPNYVISKWAEETGEVTKDLIHMAEGRQTPDKLRGEIVQALAMLHRLLIEGDQVHGLPPLAEGFAAIAAVKGGDA
jgi:hypothetical protein